MSCNFISEISYLWTLSDESDEMFLYTHVRNLFHRRWQNSRFLSVVFLRRFSQLCLFLGIRPFRFPPYSFCSFNYFTEEGRHPFVQPSNPPDQIFVFVCSSDGDPVMPPGAGFVFVTYDSQGINFYVIFSDTRGVSINFYSKNWYASLFSLTVYFVLLV
jgi:hypothetical protein